MRQTLWSNIRTLQDASRLSNSAFANLIGLEEGLLHELQRFSRDIPLDCAANLSQSFNVDLQALWASEVDAQAAERFFHRRPEELPERYRVGRFSRVRSVLNLLEGVRRQRGSEYVEQLLRYSQIPSTFFDDPDKTINVRFITDLTELLARRGWTPEQLFSLGQLSYQTHKDSAFGRSMAVHTNWRSVYEALVVEHSAAFDRNYDYRLVRREDNRIIIDALPREEVCEALQTETFDTETTCYTRMGVMSTASCYAKLPASQVTKLRSVHRGDDRNRYEIRPSSTLLYP
jgi:hypothetical protein